VPETEIAVIGGGLVGLAIAYGLQRRGRQVTVFDEGDVAFRASRGNFGLVWVQGKGAELPDYARWTRRAAALWPDFAAALREETGIDIALTQPGGLDICLDERELETNLGRLAGLRQALGGDYPFEALDHNALKELEPEIGPKVAGATYFPEDGHLNPLLLLRALHAAFTRTGGQLENDAPLCAIHPEGGAFRLDGAAGWRAGKVVLSAGLGNAKLAPMVGLEAPVVPNRGQVLICERMRPFLRHPSVRVRQVGEGTVQIGDSKEDVGFDDRTTPQVIAEIARRAVATYPCLASARVVRSWAALRVMTPDGFPLYAKSRSHTGAFLVNCHSGVTLAAIHAEVLAGWIAGGAEPDLVEAFSGKRFALHSAA
jgi:glycine/D-amino acid oxidase-like deaminating enzyme